MNKSTDERQLADLTESDPRQAFLPSKEFRLLDRYELQTELVATLEQTEKHSHLVPKVAKCHRSFRHWRCENNHDWAEAENSCSVRVCPHCAYRRTLVLAERMERFTLGKAGLRYAVLAERNTDDLRAGVKSLWESWTRLRRSVRWKKHVQGCVVALEVTYNADEGTWHPHLNVLMEGEYFPFEELNRAWIEATEHRGRTSFIRAADEGTVRELIKYVTKIADLLDDANALDEFLTAIERRRLVRTYGTFYGLKVDDEELPQQDGDCPDCGPHAHVSVVKLGYVAPQQVSLDLKGVLRVKRPDRVVRSELAAAMEFPPPIPEPRRFRPVPALAREWDRIHRRVLTDFGDQTRGLLDDVVLNRGNLPHKEQ
ncbi:MAG TPA: protein rep [Candidatus Binatia bacterium]|nr:protein rep [Candidatus Binatia bacterium]